MGSDLYFYEQCETRKVPRRYRKLPEELPESLRFAHLNPKVAALLASKERGQRLDNEDPFGDGMGKKSLLPDINAAFTNVRNQFDSAMSNDEDSQRYLFEEAKISASQVLLQLSRIIYFYEDLCEHIPRSLEYQLLSGYEDFTKDIVVIPREWQTHEMKEQYANRIQQQEAISEEEMSDNDLTGRSRSRMQSERSSEVGSKMNIRKSKQKLGLLDVTEGVEPTESRMGKRSESRLSLAPSLMKGHLDVGNISRVGSRRKGSSLSSHRSISGQSRRFRDDISLIAETPTEMRSTAMANQLSYMQTINFQLSNKSFEEKGWIMLKGRQEEVDQNTVLEYCVTRLQESMKDIANQRQKNLDQGHDKAVAVRYYGDTRKETLLKYRKSPVKSTSSLSLQKGGKPRIPSIVDECSEGKLLMQASHIDGSSVAYYPSGRPAIVHSAAGFGRPGYYTIVYEDELDSKMLACFTPAGRGVCYYPNGVVRYLATERGGHLTEENGKLIRKWKWPHSNVKITEPICFQINSQLMFRCVSQSQMFIVFSCQKESARFSVSPAPEADEYRPIEDTDQLLTAFTFSSKAAKDLMRIFAPKKQKKKSRKTTSKSQSTEIIKLLQDFPDRVTYDIEAEKELARLQRKARNLVDDWMEHYRIALGLKSPLLQNVDDLPKRRPGIRNIKSARASNHRLMIRKAIMGLDYEEDEDTLTARKKGRIPSAPLKGEIEDDIDEELQQMIAEKQQTVKFNETGQAAGDGSNSPSLLTTINRLTDTASRRSARSKASSARSGSPYRAQPATQTERVPSATSGARSFCPLVIRQHKLNYDRPQCRCSRHHIPFIMDIELDDYIATETQESQLIVIMIVSSLKNIKNKVTNVDYDFYINKEGVPFHRVFPGITKAEEMLNEIYVNQNRNRTRPCVQSRTDVFRIFKYDINSAAEMSNHVTPLLMTRHNVVPGMFLIYCDGKLLFCDHIFNGYGNARKDFKKQVMKCRHDSIQGLYLPKDFRFSPSQGKSGLRSAWGGEIGGAGVDKYSSSGTVVDASLQPIHRPNSTPTSSENSQPLPYDSVNCNEPKLSSFEREIQVRLKPFMSYRVPTMSRSTNRRPFLPRIDSQQTGTGQVYHSESISNWLSNSRPGGKANTFSTTTTSYPNSLNELY